MSGRADWGSSAPVYRPQRRLNGELRLPLPGDGRLQRSHSNDPSAGSPTETLLRLLLPLNDQVRPTFRPLAVVANRLGPVRRPHLAIQSVVATGGVYKGQGRNQRVLMTRAY